MRKTRRQVERGGRRGRTARAWMGAHLSGGPGSCALFRQEGLQLLRETESTTNPGPRVCGEERATPPPPAPTPPARSGLSALEEERPPSCLPWAHAHTRPRAGPRPSMRRAAGTQQRGGWWRATTGQWGQRRRDRLGHVIGFGMHVSTRLVQGDAPEIPPLGVRREEEGLGNATHKLAPRGQAAARPGPGAA